MTVSQIGRAEQSGLTQPSVAATTMFNVRNDNLHGVWVSLEEGKAVRLRSVLVDGHEGPGFQLNVAIAGAGQLAAQADIMDTFARAGCELLEPCRSTRTARIASPTAAGPIPGCGGAISDPTSLGNPGWSPDGTKIVLVRLGNIYTVKADGSGLTQVTRSGLREEFPDWGTHPLAT